MVAAFGAGRGWPYFDPDYESLSASMNAPKVAIDNTAFPDSTLIKLDTLNRHGIFLEAVQVLVDVELFISKAYASSDGGWTMYVFHVTDAEGHKITEPSTLRHIEATLEQTSIHSSPRRCRTEERTHVSLGITGSSKDTAIELTGPDRPGLLSEIFTTLSSLALNIATAEVWTHNMRVAALIFVEQVDDEERLLQAQKQLHGFLKGDGRRSPGKTSLFSGLTHTERRLHQMMSDDGNFTSEGDVASSAADSTTLMSSSVGGNRSDSDSESSSSSSSSRSSIKPVVTVTNCVERGYSVVNIHCRDRSKLLFDTVCTLTDMDYMIFHATILSEGEFAYQEFYIRHIDGDTLETESQRQRLIKCLVAAIQRRFSQGLRLELCASDRVGLLSDVTRVFQKHGLSVAGAYVSTQRGMAVNTFYVTDVYGSPVDAKALDSIRGEIGLGLHLLRVKDPPVCPQLLNLDTSMSPPTRFSLGSFFRAHSERLLYTLGLIKSA